LTDLLGKEGNTSFKSVMGTLQYASLSRPEKLGALAKLHEQLGKEDEATWQSVKDANDLLLDMQRDNDACCMWYPPLGEVPSPVGYCPSLALYTISDSAFKNMSDRKSQGGYVIALVLKRPGQLGGRLHVIEFASRKSRRVAKSTWSAELHAFVVAVERLERIHGWISEIFLGPTKERGIARLNVEAEPFCDCYGIVDCRGLFDSLTSPTMGSLLDVSMQVYVLAAREAFANGPLSHIAWVPTTEMLSDSLTKAFTECPLWNRLYQTGEWVPKEAIVCARTGNNGRSISNFKAFHEFLSKLHDEEYDEESWDDELAYFFGFLSRGLFSAMN
jgi:hypothetical protein